MRMVFGDGVTCWECCSEEGKFVELRGRKLLICGACLRDAVELYLREGDGRRPPPSPNPPAPPYVTRRGGPEEG